MPGPSGQDTSGCRLEAGATVMGRAQVQGALQMEAGTWMCHTPAPSLGSLLWRRFGGAVPHSISRPCPQSTQ